jgi:hypothetical protein
MEAMMGDESGSVAGVPPVVFHGIVIKATPRPSPVLTWDGRAYQAAVRRVLDGLFASCIGRILIRHIAREAKVVEIIPEPHYAPPGGGRGARVVPAREPAGLRAGTSTFRGVATGQPGDARIEFTPFFHADPRAQGTARDDGPGSCVDEVLLEELFHALRCLLGVLDWGEAPFDFHSRDEFHAAMVVNMYRSEKGRRLSHAHVRGMVREHLVSPWRGRSSQDHWERGMLRDLGREMPDLTSVLRRVPRVICGHNPFIDYLEGPSYSVAVRAPRASSRRHAP